MAVYCNDELISSTDISKSFWKYLQKINSWELQKIWILKNNKIKAVMLSGDLYEKLWDYIEDLQISYEIKDRINLDKKDYLDAEDVLKDFSLSI